MTTAKVSVEQAIGTHYTPGLHYWGRATNGHIGVVAQNSNGAIEYRVEQSTGIGELVIHAPTCITGWADTLTAHCVVGGGLCFEGHSHHAYNELIRPLLEDDDIDGVLDKLDEIHRGYFGQVAR